MDTDAVTIVAQSVYLLEHIKTPTLIVNCIASDTLVHAMLVVYQALHHLDFRECLIETRY